MIKSIAPCMKLHQRRLPHQMVFYRQLLAHFACFVYLRVPCPPDSCHSCRFHSSPSPSARFLGRIYVTFLIQGLIWCYMQASVLWHIWSIGLRRPWPWPYPSRLCCDGLNEWFPYIWRYLVKQFTAIQASSLRNKPSSLKTTWVLVSEEAT